MSEQHRTWARGAGKSYSLRIGQHFDRLEVISEPMPRRRVSLDCKRSNVTVYYRCRCDCGNETEVPYRELAERKSSRSCGCLQRELAGDAKRTHGMAGTHLYVAWENMKARCERKSNRDFHNYGGRGIKFCDAWNQFEPFRDWALANGYGEGLTLDRENPDKNYGPDNCRWITKEDQGRTMRKCVHLAAFGETKTIREWARDPRCRVTHTTLRFRLGKGIPLEVALVEPPDERYVRN